MNKHFITNCLHLLNYHWRMEKSRCLRLFFIVFSIFLFIQWFGKILAFIDTDFHRAFVRTFNEELIYWGFILIPVSYLFTALHHQQRAITYLSLPASPAEKFIVRVVFGTLFISLIVFTARILANLTAISFQGIYQAMRGRDPEWQLLFHYRGLPGHWHLASIFKGTMSMRLFIIVFIGQNILALNVLSLFTLFGLWFRKMGWAWAFVALLFEVALLALISTIFKDTNHIDKVVVNHVVMAFSLLLTIVNYILAYHCFCRSQIVGHQFMNL